jgi:plastocyanin
MRRREVFASLGIGSAALVSGGALARSATAPAAARHEAGHGQEEVLSGPLASATVSFGQWRVGTQDNPFDRFTTPNVIARNHHLLAPNEVTIKAGGAVSFIVAGFHNPIVYDDGWQPSQIKTDPLHIVPGSTPPGLIDDPDGRIFRGVDPRTVSQDRVESVTFANPGRYLVICGVRPHFVNDNMFGFVRVLP